MEAAWVKVLKGLRANQDFALFGLVSSLDDIVFTADAIQIRTHNAAEYHLLTKHLDQIKTLAGTENITIEDRTHTDRVLDDDYIAKLQDLFGDKLEIM